MVVFTLLLNRVYVFANFMFKFEQRNTAVFFEKQTLVRTTVRLTKDLWTVHERERGDDMNQQQQQQQQQHTWRRSTHFWRHPHPVWLVLSPVMPCPGLLLSSCLWLLIAVKFGSARHLSRPASFEWKTWHLPPARVSLQPTGWSKANRT